MTSQMKIHYRIQLLVLLFFTYRKYSMMQNSWRPALGFLLLLCASLPAARSDWQSVFYDDFELYAQSGNNAFPNSVWIAAPRDGWPVHATTIPVPGLGNVLAFNDSSVGGGDIWTNRLIGSPTGRYRVQFDYYADPSAGMFIAWALVWRYPIDPFFGCRSFWFVDPTPGGAYCSGGGNWSCSDSWTQAESNSSWAHYDLEFTLVGESPGACPLDPLEAAMGIRISIEQTGALGTGSALLDNLRVWVYVNDSAPTTTVPIQETTLVEFQSDTPNHFLTAVDPATGEALINNSVGVFFDQLVEVTLPDFNDTFIAVKLLAFPSSPIYTVRKGPAVTLPGVDVEFGFVSSNVTSVTLGFTAFNESQPVSYAGSAFTVGNNTLKWAMQILDWQFAHPSDLLRFEVLIDTYDEHFYIVSTEFVAHESLHRFTLFSNTTNLALTLSLSELVVIDGDPKRMANAPRLTNALHDQVTIGEVADRIVFFFPSFNHSLYYDPDFGIVLQSSSSDGGDGGDEEGDGGDNNDLLYLIAISALVPIAIIIVVVVIGSAVALTLWRSRRSNWKPTEPRKEMVQWGSQTSLRAVRTGFEEEGSAL